MEDNHVNQLVAVAILEHLGFTTEVAGHGLEALASCARRSFVAILMDCRMPEMDGYPPPRRSSGSRVLRLVRRSSPMTADVGDSERERCLLAGMDDYVSKPVSMADIDAKILRWLPAIPT